MKLIAKLGDEEFDVEIKRAGGRVSAEIDGRKYDLEISEPEEKVFLIKKENEIFEAFFSESSDRTGEPSKIKIGGKEFEIEIIDPKKLRGGGAGADGAAGTAEIKTAMPGKVVRVLLEKNAEVKAGEGVIVVEAMKMQNEMKSPKDGIVSEIRFKEGDTVNAGDVLVVIE